MKIIVTGATGQLGLEVVEQLTRSRLKVAGFSHDDLDITDENSVSNYFSVVKPDLVVNCAAFTQVDEAQTDPGKAYDINQRGAGIIAHSCHKTKTPLIHLSTDFVFDGKENTPYVETDPINPLGIYGKSKALGEKEIAERLDTHIIIRTSWLYGVHGKNFVKTMISAATKTDSLRVVSDQFGCPTSAADLARAITDIVKQKNTFNNRTWGIYHYCGDGIVSWHTFAETIFQMAADLKPMPAVHPVSTDEYPVKAPRPAYSALDCKKINAVFGITLKPWRQSLSIVVNRLLSKEKSHLFP
jgi:dTDP-4-dehydrorhamnose reductase